jgi:hypothetical protein
MKLSRYILLLVAALSVGVPAQAKEWAEWRGGDLKYAMLLATDMRVVDKDFEDGWFGINAVTDSGETIFVLYRQMPRFEQQVVKAYVEDFAGITLGVPSQVEPSKGWTYRERHEISDRGSSYWVEMGQGPGGTYAFILSTNSEDLELRKNEYTKWRESLELW